MSKPRVFVGSSQTNYAVAEVIKEGLDKVSYAETWAQGVFGLNFSFLETLLKTLEDYDFAVFVLAPDDTTTSKDETKPAPRDNVLFESGLFMGVLGRERVFLVYDESAGVKIPSDLLGITLASYDGSRMGQNPEAAVSAAVRRISEKITASQYAYLLGDWASRYIVTMKEGNPTVDETVSVRPCRDGLSIESKENPLHDDYKAMGRMRCDKQMIGTWRSRSDLGDDEGLFILTVRADNKVMYGYFTAPDMEGRIVYATWVLAKKDGEEEEAVQRRLSRGQESLSRITVGPPVAPGTAPNPAV